MSLSKTLYPLLSTGAIQETSGYYYKIVNCLPFISESIFFCWDRVHGPCHKKTGLPRLLPGKAHISYRDYCKTLTFGGIFIWRYWL